MSYAFIAADVLSIAMLAVALVLSIVDSFGLRQPVVFWASIVSIAWLFLQVLG